MPQNPAPPLGSAASEAALLRALEQRLQAQTKPPGSLGALEHIGLRLGLLQGTALPRVENMRVCVFAASHGIAAEGVSAYPPEVTGQMVANFLAGGAAICVLARAAYASLHVIDTGVDAPTPPDTETLPHFFARSVRRGTRSFLTGAAMTAPECEAALYAGREQVFLAGRDGVEALALGEMGIGNTTSAAALCAALLPAAPEQVTGPGTGVGAEGLAKKRAVVAQALEFHRGTLADPASPRAWLEAVGGYEIAAMTGCILAASEARLPVVVDGFIATAAALVAARIQPKALECCFFGHLSEEPGHAIVLEALGVTPLLQLGLRLGEGTGAALALPLLRASARLLCEMATFESAGVSGAEIAEAAESTSASPFPSDA